MQAVFSRLPAVCRKKFGAPNIPATGNGHLSGYCRKTHFTGKTRGIKSYPFDLFIEMFHVKHKEEGA
jgi:hypothetical protein